MQNKLCYIGNTAPRYREAIFQAIDKEYSCDWYFGKTKTDIKEMDLSLLKNACYYATYGNPFTLYWKSGILKLLFKREYKTFLMLAESRSLTDYIFLGLSKILKKKVYIWTHGWYGKETKIEAIMKRWQFKRATGIFIYGNYARQLMIEQGFSGDKIFTIHNSLHYDIQKNIRESIVPSDLYCKHFCNDYHTLIFIGRLTKVKKLDLLVEALDELNARGEKYNLVFVGNGSEKYSLEKKVEVLRLSDNVWFYGECYDERQNAELLYNADLCIAPGNIGLTAIHALVFGCPCISHNNFKLQMPEFEVIRQGKTGDFFEIDSVKSLADSISKWFKENSDKRDEVRYTCFKEIDTQWNPHFQIEVLKKNLKFK